MAKILEFKKIKERIQEELTHLQTSCEEVEDDISAIANDHSLTPANRRYLLENLLMDMDDKLEEYKREMDLAERKLDAIVQASEKEIEAAYSEYIDRVTNLTESVKNLAKSRRSRHT